MSESLTAKTKAAISAATVASLPQLQVTLLKAQQEGLPDSEPCRTLRSAASSSAKLSRT